MVTPGCPQRSLWPAESHHCQNLLGPLCISGVQAEPQKRPARQARMGQAVLEAQAPASVRCTGLFNISVSSLPGPHQLHPRHNREHQMQARGSPPSGTTEEPLPGIISPGICRLAGHGHAGSSRRPRKDGRTTPPLYHGVFHAVHHQSQRSDKMTPSQ